MTQRRPDVWKDTIRWLMVIALFGSIALGLAKVGGVSDEIIQTQKELVEAIHKLHGMADNPGVNGTWQ